MHMHTLSPQALRERQKLVAALRAQDPGDLSLVEAVFGKAPPPKDKRVELSTAEASA